MTRNEGNFDRGLRALVGLALIAMVLFAEIASPLLNWGAIIIGLVLLLTAVTGFCPIYRLFGVNTCRMQ